MAKQLKILTINNKKEEETLRKESISIPEEEIQTKEFQEFIDDLLETGKNSEIEAVGIAAPQVGINKRVFCMEDQDTKEWFPLINPEIIPLDLTKATVEEACLSVPNQEGKVLRYKNVKIKYQDREGKAQAIKYRNFSSVIAQHENDHLNGILFIDKIIT